MYLYLFSLTAKRKLFTAAHDFTRRANFEKRIV
jgi:hypothetical protein